MNIAFDYDKTISRDPFLFVSLMETFCDYGHRCYVVTGRKRDLFEGDMDWLHKQSCITGVFCTDWKAKKPYMLAQGIEIDIWIDDQPWAVTEDYDPEKERK